MNKSLLFGPVCIQWAKPAKYLPGVDTRIHFKFGWRLEKTWSETLHCVHSKASSNCFDVYNRNRAGTETIIHWLKCIWAVQSILDSVMNWRVVARKLSPFIIPVPYSTKRRELHGLLITCPQVHYKMDWWQLESVQATQRFDSKWEYYQTQMQYCGSLVKRLYVLEIGVKIKSLSLKCLFTALGAPSIQTDLHLIKTFWSL